jgi:hypothetical protein
MARVTEGVNEEQVLNKQSGLFFGFKNLFHKQFFEENLSIK